MTYDYGKVCHDAAMSVTQCKRQEFLDCIWSGMRLGEAYEKVGISFEAANGIMIMNIKDRKYLNRESE